MDIRIIEKATESTVISFLKDVYPKMSLWRLDFCGPLLHSIIRLGSTLLSKLSKDKIMCQACSGVAQGSKQPVDTTNKGIQESISRFLKDTDLNTDKYLLDNGMKHVSDDTTIAFDQSDIRDVLKIGIRYGRLGPGHFGRFWPNPLDALHLRSPATCVHRSGGLGSKPSQTVSGPIFRTSH